MKLRISSLLVFGTLALAACNDSGTDPSDLERGDFEGTVRGEFSMSIDGTAESGNTPGFGQDQIVLTDAAEDVTVFALHLDDEFSEGREALADIDDTQGIGAGVIIGNRLFIADSGTMDIDDLSSAGIRGTLEFTAIEVDPQTEEILDDEVTVDVVFNTDYDSNCCFNRAATATFRVNKAPAR